MTGEKTPQELLSPALIAARTPAQMEALAAELERIAAVIRQVAAAKRRDEQRPPEKRVRRSGGKGGRPSAVWIYVFRQARKGAADSLFIRFSRSLYYAAGQPERLDPQRRGADLVFAPARGDAGYKVSVSPGYVKINASGARDLIDLDDGRYAAELRAGTIVAGKRLDGETRGAK